MQVLHSHYTCIPIGLSFAGNYTKCFPHLSCNKKEIQEILSLNTLSGFELEMSQSNHWRSSISLERHISAVYTWFLSLKRAYMTTMAVVLNRNYFWQITALRAIK